MNAIQNYVWGLSKKQQYADNETVIQITTTQPNQTFEWHSVTGPVQYYDWNGTRTNSKSHTFANAGVHTIKIVGDISHFKINNNNITNNLITKIIHVASSITSFYQSFLHCTGLTSIPNGLFDKNINVNNFGYCFLHCTGLTSIPNGLFDKNINVNNFIGCFYGCINLTNRPKPHGLEIWQIAGTNGRPSNINIQAMFRNCISMPDYNNLPNSVK